MKNCLLHILQFFFLPRSSSWSYQTLHPASDPRFQWCHSWPQQVAWKAQGKGVEECCEYGRSRILSLELEVSDRKQGEWFIEWYFCTKHSSILHLAARRRSLRLFSTKKDLPHDSKSSQAEAVTKFTWWDFRGFDGSMFQKPFWHIFLLLLYTFHFMACNEYWVSIFDTDWNNRNYKTYWSDETSPEKQVLEACAITAYGDSKKEPYLRKKSSEWLLISSDLPCLDFIFLGKDRFLFVFFSAFSEFLFGTSSDSETASIFSSRFCVAKDAFQIGWRFW